MVFLACWRAWYKSLDYYCSQLKKLVGLAIDRVSANIAANGLNGLVVRQLSWIFWMWCLAHRLELAIRDALKGTTHLKLMTCY